MRLKGQEFEQLQKALLNAFDTDSLEQMLKFKLNKDLYSITTPSGLEKILFDLITRANKEGWIAELIAFAKEDRPQNQIFNSVADELLSKLLASNKPSKGQENGNPSNTTSSQPDNVAIPSLPAISLNLYIPRNPLEEEQALNRLGSHSEPIVVIGAGRSGKTTLLYYLLDKFLEKNNTKEITYVYINFSDFLDEITDFDSLLKNIATKIVEKVWPNDVEGRIKRIWGSRFAHAQDKIRTLMKEHVLPETKGLFILLIDEADCIYDKNFHSGFFSMLQAWCKNPDSIWSKFRLMVAISRTRIDLIEVGSPFNIGIEIVLQEFNEQQVMVLSSRYDLPNWTSEQIKQLMAIVGGNPALVNSIMRDATNSQIPLCDLLDPKKNTSFSPFLNHARRLLKINPKLQEELTLFKDGELRLPNNLKLCKALTRFGLLIEKSEGNNRYFRLSCSLYKQLLED